MWWPTLISLLQNEGNVVSINSTVVPCSHEKFSEPDVRWRARTPVWNMKWRVIT